MQAFTQHQGLVVPLDRANVDTDLIIPKQFLKSIKRTGFGPNLFDQLRYLDEGQPGMDNSSRRKNKDFVLNQERYKKATVLLAKENFGCGSSREHAPWALLDYGFRVVLAPSFADIFYNNCFKNGMLPIVLQDNVINELFEDVEMNEGYSLAIDLQEEQITKPDGRIIEFIVEPFRKHCLINGLDDIGLTLEKSAKIKMFETDRVQLVPWMFS